MVSCPVQGSRQYSSRQGAEVSWSRVAGCLQEAVTPGWVLPARRRVAGGLPSRGVCGAVSAVLHRIRTEPPAAAAETSANGFIDVIRRKACRSANEGLLTSPFESTGSVASISDIPTADRRSTPARPRIISRPAPTPDT